MTDNLLIKKSGYLVKSPPKERKFLLSRWMLRWFVLYDNKNLCEEGEWDNREVHFFYFKDEQSFADGDAPYGRIPMKQASVRMCAKEAHGYDHVLTLETSTRRYHLCGTSALEIREWFEALRVSTMSPNDQAARRRESSIAQEIRRNSSMPPNLRRESNRGFIRDKKFIFEKTFSTVAESPSTSTDGEADESDLTEGTSGGNIVRSMSSYELHRYCSLEDEYPLDGRRKHSRALSKIMCLPADEVYDSKDSGDDRSDEIELDLDVGGEGTGDEGYSSPLVSREKIYLEEDETYNFSPHRTSHRDTCNRKQEKVETLSRQVSERRCSCPTLLQSSNHKHKSFVHQEIKVNDEIYVEMPAQQEGTRKISSESFVSDCSSVSASMSTRSKESSIRTSVSSKKSSNSTVIGNQPSTRDTLTVADSRTTTLRRSSPKTPTLNIVSYDPFESSTFTGPMFNVSKSKSTMCLLTRSDRLAEL